MGLCVCVHVACRGSKDADCNSSNDQSGGRSTWNKKSTRALRSVVASRFPRDRGRGGGVAAGGAGGGGGGGKKGGGGGGGAGGGCGVGFFFFFFFFVITE